MTPTITRYIADPAYGDGSTIVASSDSTQTWVKPSWAEAREALAQDRRERDMRELGFGQRQSVCG